jgi:hypothetical protein
MKLQLIILVRQPLGLCHLCVLLMSFVCCCEVL